MNTTLLGVIAAVCSAIVAVFQYMLAKHNDKSSDIKEQNEKIEKAKDDITDACNSGSISDLFDATKKLGDVNK